MMFRFSPPYALLALLLFLVELAIALFVKDNLIRPFVGDLLVVVLLYCLAATFVQCRPWLLALGVLAFAWLIEWGQYFQLVTLLGLQDNRLARIVIGSTFDPLDLLAYSLGALLAAVLASRFGRVRDKKRS